MQSKSKTIILLTFILTVLLQNVWAAVRLPLLISDGMVLQRDTKIKLWGWANASEKVTIAFNGSNYTTVTGADGQWSINTTAMKAGGPYTMDISSENHITIKNILIGDVWVCSGQSNMELPIERVKKRYPDLIANSSNTNIREFDVPIVYDFNTPQNDVRSGSWEEASPATVPHFSATAYFFANALYQKYHVPIGLIKSCVGGTPAQSWISEDALKSFPNYLAVAGKYKNSTYVDSIQKQNYRVTSTWNANIKQHDEGLNGAKTWYDSSYDATGWPSLQLPGYWDNQGLKNTNGVVWLRKQFEVPANLAGQAADLELGRIVDEDFAYINGVFVGTTGYQYPPRWYKVPAGLLKAGTNTIVVRVINNSGKGGFVLDKPYELKISDQKIDLKGTWQYKLGLASAPMPPTTTIQYQPLGLYNGMIAPLLNYRIKGAIWYQGEANTFNPSEYTRLMSTLIANWRQNWDEGNFPFLFVQLANFMETRDTPSESNWAKTRDAQLKTLAVPNTGMAVIMDTGNWNDIHPTDKKDVGDRLALAAEKVAYGDKKVISSGPLYKDMKIDGDKVIISFNDTGSGLMAKNGSELKYFAIAGADRKFVWAKAKIEGNTIVLWADGIKNPVAVRYAWADNPEGANLYNKENLPASPFRTDEW